MWKDWVRRINSYSVFHQYNEDPPQEIAAQYVIRLKANIRTVALFDSQHLN